MGDSGAGRGDPRGLRLPTSLAAVRRILRRSAVTCRELDTTDILDGKNVAGVEFTARSGQKAVASSRKQIPGQRITVKRYRTCRVNPGAWVLALVGRGFRLLQRAGSTGCGYFQPQQGYPRVTPWRLLSWRRLASLPASMTEPVQRIGGLSQ